MQDDDSEDLVYSVSNPPTPKQTRKKITSDAESENTYISGTSSQSNSSSQTMSPTDKQTSMFTNSTEAVLGKSVMLVPVSSVLLYSQSSLALIH